VASGAAGLRACDGAARPASPYSCRGRQDGEETGGESRGARARYNCQGSPRRAPRADHTGRRPGPLLGAGAEERERQRLRLRARRGRAQPAPSTWTPAWPPRPRPSTRVPAARLQEAQADCYFSARQPSTPRFRGPPAAAPALLVQRACPVAAPRRHLVNVNVPSRSTSSCDKCSLSRLSRKVNPNRCPKCSAISLSPSYMYVRTII